VVLDSNGGLSCTVVEASRAVQAVSVSNRELSRTVVEASRAVQAVSASNEELGAVTGIPASCS
jgi:alkyl hydroperoxide reductase subunit AhpC